MIPLADIVALSTSVSNHWSSMSAALMVMSWIRLCCAPCGRGLEAAGQARRAAAARPGPCDSGSGGVMERIGLTKRAISTMALAYSS